jgi:IMP dehydrogenase/GMP reductase
MKILDDVGLSFDDVLLVPRKSTISSRFSGGIDLSTTLVPGLKLKYPIISANMDTTTGFKLANTLSEAGALGIIHRFLSVEDHLQELLNANNDQCPVVLCIGVGKEQFEERFLKIFEYDNPRINLGAVLIDIAHGHSDSMLRQIERVRLAAPELSIIAGNVATYKGTADLLSAGARSVKCGVGPGCLGAGTRILMANGLYKNIEDIKLHDKVINRNGEPVEVIGVRCSGFRDVVKYRGNLFYKETLVTGEHLHLIGDFSSTPHVLEDGSLAKTLDKREKVAGFPSKYKWLSIEELSTHVCLMPRNIHFDIPESFVLNLKDISLSHRNWKHFIDYPEIHPSYDLGYIFGLFLGDGTSNLKHYKRGTDSRNLTGSLSWSFGLHESIVAEKLQAALNGVFGCFANTKLKRRKNVLMVLNRSNVLCRLFGMFGKKDGKHLPEQFWCSDHEYLKGLLDGLIDSDGHLSNDGRLGFTNTSIQLIELFMTVFALVNGYYPSITIRQPSIGGLSNCNIENCKPSYEARGLKSPEYVLTSDFQINRAYSGVEKSHIAILTYDIETNCKTHSFIANNAIVHNSVCSTRIQTGNGVPQLTAIMECRQAIDDFGDVSISLIADGGIRFGGDIVKALASGANAVMIGNLFAGTEEAIGEVISTRNGLIKAYRGMASLEAQKSWKGYATSIEGEMMNVPYKGSAVGVLGGLISGILSGMSYQDARNIRELQDNAVFIRQTSAGHRESQPYALLKE